MVGTHAPVVFSSPAIGADGTVYVGAGDRLYAVSAAGQLKWSVTACLPGGTISSAPAVGADGSIVFHQVRSGGLISAALCAVDESGLPRWQFVTQGQFDNTPRISSPAIGGDGLVYVGSPDGHIYAIQGPVFRGLLGRVMIPVGPRNGSLGS
jgi:outer membrane protein assembly factor BamB